MARVSIQQILPLVSLEVCLDHGEIDGSALVTDLGGCTGTLIGSIVKTLRINGRDERQSTSLFSPAFWGHHAIEGFQEHQPVPVNGPDSSLQGLAFGSQGIHHLPFHAV